MGTELTTMNDARRIVYDWIENYVDRNGITEEQINRAAFALVDHVGGYGAIFDVDDTRDFDLDFHIYGGKS